MRKFKPLNPVVEVVIFSLVTILASFGVAYLLLREPTTSYMHIRSTQSTPAQKKLSIKSGG